MKGFSLVNNKDLLNISYDHYFVMLSQKTWTKTSSLSQIKFATLLAKGFFLM